MAWGAGRLDNRRAVAYPGRSIPHRCPGCGGRFRAGGGPFLVVGRGGDAAVVSGEGRFCTGCPIVVLDADHFHEMARLGLPEEREFTIAGFVDLDAVPEDKKRVPLGEDDNPIPFVEFESFEWRNRGGSPAGQARSRKGPALNAKCPFGSGRKYKRCCMVGQEARA